MTDSPSRPAAAAGVSRLRNQDSVDHGNEADSVRLLMNALFSMLSHDLRTPLSAISGWLFLLESDRLDPAARKRALEKMRANIQEQVQLIDDALLLSRSKTGHLQLDVTSISPLVPLSAALESIRPSAIAKGVDLAAAKPAQDGLVNADPERLRRVFELLLAHGVKSTPPGGAIETAVRAADGRSEISITDNGNGFSAGDLPFVLDPFGRPDQASGRSGQSADRGLLLAGALIEAHAGRLLVTSPGAGLGATFTVELPGVAR